MTPFQRQIYTKVLDDMDNWSSSKIYEYAVDMRKTELKTMSFFSLMELSEKIDLEAQL